MSIRYIAEIGNNHNGDIKLAKKMIDAALDAQADYIKFQVYNIDKFVHRDSIYYKDSLAEKLPFAAFKELKKYIAERGGRLLLTPFDEDSLRLIAELGLDAVKISSGDIDNKQLLNQAVRLKKELFVSTGGATLVEIDDMVRFLKSKKARFSILHCILEYPAKFEDLNLRFIEMLKKRHSCPVGYSDHSLGIEAALAAIALGATIIEKHFTTDRLLPGGDNAMSILPNEFRRLKREGDNIELALGSCEKSLSENEEKIKKFVRRRFYAKRDIPKDRVVRDEDLILLRAGNLGKGLDATYYSLLVGRRTARNIKKGEMITRLALR